MQRRRNPLFPTTPRGRGIPRRLVLSPTNLRIDALRYMPCTRLGEEARQFLGEMVTTQRALQRDCAHQREEANAWVNVQNQALIRLMEAFRDKELDPRLLVQPAQPLQDDSLTRHSWLDPIFFRKQDRQRKGMDRVHWRFGKSQRLANSDVS